MKGVVSLLPSGTETVIELGYRDRLLGVSHECEVGCGLDVVTFGKFDGEGVTQREIGALYEASRSDAFLFEGWEVEKSLVKFRLCSYYWTDVDKLMELRPDVIVTVVDETDLVAFEEVELAVKALLEKNDVAIVNFNPSSVAQTWQLTKELATLMGDPKHGIDYVRQSQQRCFQPSSQKMSMPPLRNADSTHHALSVCIVVPIVSLVQASSPSSAIASQSVAVVQWLDPLYMSGAWVPELVQYTGAADAFCKPGQPSQSLTWTQVSRTNPDVIVVALCALTVDQTEKEVCCLSHVTVLPGASETRNQKFKWRK